MQRRLRDKGWIETEALISSGITRGTALEIGPGPGYLGLEWLKSTQGTTLKGVDISAEMVALARRNAADGKLSARADYIQSTGADLPFPDGSFDAVFSASSLHEWSDPRATLLHAWRVLRTGGRLLVLDFRRDMSPLVKWGLWLVARPKSIRPGLVTSLNAAYTPGEARALVDEAGLSSCRVGPGPAGLRVIGIKG